jgi:hypothetical protein
VLQDVVLVKTRLMSKSVCKYRHFFSHVVASIDATIQTPINRSTEEMAAAADPLADVAARCSLAYAAEKKSALCAAAGVFVVCRDPVSTV